MIDKICELKNKFIELAESEMAKGAHCVDTKEMGEVIDMIKDLAEAEKDLMKACYYSHMMADMGHEEGRMGYDRWRYSSGRYAPKGRGHRTRMGYPDGDTWPTVDPWMGVDGDSTANRYGYPVSDMPKYGDSYENYKRARRHYTDTHSPEAKNEMSEHAKHHMEESIETMRDIWQDADPDMKKKMKTEFTSFLNEMM